MKPVIALLLGLCAPGAAQIFNGEFTKGIVFGVLFALGRSVFLPLCLRIFSIRSERAVLLTFLWANRLFVGVILYALVDGVYQAFFVSQTYGWSAVLSAVMIVAVSKNTFKNFLFTALCGRAGLFEILVPKRISPSENIKK